MDSFFLSFSRSISQSLANYFSWRFMEANIFVIASNFHVKKFPLEIILHWHSTGPFEKHVWEFLGTFRLVWIFIKFNLYFLPHNHKSSNYVSDSFSFSPLFSRFHSMCNALTSLLIFSGGSDQNWMLFFAFSDKTTMNC